MVAFWHEFGPMSGAAYVVERRTSGHLKRSPRLLQRLVDFASDIRLGKLPGGRLRLRL